MDALTHCIEAYLAKDYHPVGDGIALEGLRLAAPSLPRGIEKPEDIARIAMMIASMTARSRSEGAGTGPLVRADLSTVADLHHGLANGMMIDHALPFDVPAAEEKFKNMAQVIGLTDTRPEAFLRWLTDLKQELSNPAGLTAAGVKSVDLDRLTELAFQHSCHQNNPRPCSREDFRRIYAAAV